MTDQNAGEGDSLETRQKKRELEKLELEILALRKPHKKPQRELKEESKSVSTAAH